jgi:hypothetical protein
MFHSITTGLFCSCSRRLTAIRELRAVHPKQLLVNKLMFSTATTKDTETTTKSLPRVVVLGTGWGGFTLVGSIEKYDVLTNEIFSL